MKPGTMDDILQMLKLNKLGLLASFKGGFLFCKVIKICFNLL